ncbi:hypothetical protein DFH27DRAFT_512191 [Peziza echinospora]|nr:hypothetical protein DFH27DRAFT_512191 [Peziza echinospora]
MALAAAAPAPEPQDVFYQAVPTALFGVAFENNPTKRSALAEDPRFNLIGKRTNELTNVRHVLTRSPRPEAAPQLYVDYVYGDCTFWYTCEGSPFGPCCGPNASCGSGWGFCDGGCDQLYGDCVEPKFQMAFDADLGDVIWDPVTDNVFEAAPGDGFLYYGTAPTGAGWPNPYISG